MEQDIKAYNNVSELIGNTPLIKLQNITKGLKGNYFAKVEAFNPGHSSKDRIALYILEQAEKKGILKKGDTIIETTSGNTGFSLAMVSIIKGYDCILAVSSKSSKDIHSFVWCIVLPTDPNSITGHISLINLASEVPPLVDNSGFKLVTSFTASLIKSTNFPGGVKKGSPLNSVSKVHLIPSDLDKSVFKIFRIYSHLGVTWNLRAIIFQCFTDKSFGES